ncbi:hypothetical protein GCWU000324_01697 [Kingella oralis ATCC 51147]|uniref:Uncharacterized protein n=1 Tax=Kingella oralis ATCC 51147 TaxID=629741 RepID=C4GL41_9NEIS|nr:hypothetical protein GCWU000324_01697 [Kingella oralis ATCC 51147]
MARGCPIGGKKAALNGARQMDDGRKGVVHKIPFRANRQPENHFGRAFGLRLFSGCLVIGAGMATFEPLADPLMLDQP